MDAEGKIIEKKTEEIIDMIKSTSSPLEAANVNEIFDDEHSFLNNLSDSKRCKSKVVPFKFESKLKVKEGILL